MSLTKSLNTQYSSNVVSTRSNTCASEDMSKVNACKTSLKTDGSKDLTLIQEQEETK